MSPFQKMRDVLRRDDGFSLPEVMVSVLVNGACMVIIAGSLVAFAAVQQQVATRTANSNNAAVVESHWRNSGQAATNVTPISETAVVFTRPSIDGDDCTRMRFDLTADSGSRKLTVTRQTFTGLPDAATGLCSGTSKPSVVVATAPDVGADARFTYRTTVGRGTTFADGTQTMAVGEAPSGVSAARWSSKTLGAATAELEIGSLSGHGKNTSIAQLLAGLTEPAGAAIAQTRYVTQ